MIAIIGLYVFPGISAFLAFVLKSLVISGVVLLLLVGLYIAMADRADEIDTRTEEGRNFYELYSKRITNKWVLVAVLLGLFGYLGFIPVRYVLKRNE